MILPDLLIPWFVFLCHYLTVFNAEQIKYVYIFIISLAIETLRSKTDRDDYLYCTIVEDGQ